MKDLFFSFLSCYSELITNVTSKAKQETRGETSSSEEILAIDEKIWLKSNENDRISSDILFFIVSNMQLSLNVIPLH